MAGLPGVLEKLHALGLLPGDHVAVFCVGSVARGWANASSDFDLNVVTAQPWSGAAQGSMIPVSTRPGAVPVTETYVDGRRWEAKYWLDTQVDQILAKVAWERFEGATDSLKVLLPTEELFLERLVSCLPLSGVAWVQRRQRELASTAFRAFVTSRSLAEADDAVEDALGQLGSGDIESAVLSARKGLGHIVDAILESAGNYGSHTPKWRARRFREVSPEQLTFDEYWRLETMRDFDAADPRPWIEHVCARCKDLSLDVEIS
jgi:hypothetical protein